MNATTLKIIFVFMTTTIVLACAGVSDPWKLPVRHQQQDPDANLRLCLDCHEEAAGEFPYGRFVHTVYFAENHRRAAEQQPQVCSMCHQPSDCDTCHGVGVELKPSLRQQTRTGKRMPHRGDYLSRHRIDGRMDPLSCLRCHGNPKTAKTCTPCHG